MTTTPRAGSPPLPPLGPVPPETQPGLLSPAQRLAADATVAAQVRAIAADPAVVALHVEHIRTQTERLMGAGIVLGLCFTMTNVQTFAATGSPVGSLGWFAAWLLDPMVSLVLLAVLRAEQLTTRHHVNTGPWPRVAKWVLLSATYLMNTWSAWATGSGSEVVLHSVPPLVVVIAAEALTDLQCALTTCAQRAAHLRTEPPVPAQPGPLLNTSREENQAPVNTPRAASVNPPPPVSPTTPPAFVNNPRATPVNTPRTTGAPSPPAGQPRRAQPTADTRGRRSDPVRRKLLADYLTEARAAWRPGVMISPAWVRQVTDCSRGLSSKVAAALNANPAVSATSPAPTTTTAMIDSEGRAA
jgi:hypothetical protein